METCAKEYFARVASGFCTVTYLKMSDRPTLGRKHNFEYRLSLN